ncbi:MAG: FxsA family protein [Magnetovibrio sp.]|nr:FxsA family protein [Magnetovibrio sp.]
MGLIILIAFIAIPLIEIGLFIQVGEIMGMWPTISVVIITAIAGTTLLRLQGLNALNRLQNSLNAGELPLAPVFDGFCLLAAGALLLTPGFFTDSIGFLLFVPPLRDQLRKYLTKRVQFQQSHTDFSGPTKNPPSPSPDDVIDGDWQDITPDKPDKGEKSGKSLSKDDNTLD